MSDVKFALYVSSVEGRVVPRFSTVRLGKPPVLIGATRDHKDPTKIIWDTERIIGIPEAEYARFGREYNRELRGGGLRLRSEKEYADWVHDQVRADEAKTAKADADAKTKQAPSNEVVS